MAATTYTYTIRMAENPRELHAGVNVLAFDWNSGANKFGTLSDVLLLGKVPNGALITNADIRTGASGAAAIHCQLQLLAIEASGTFSLLTNLIASLTASTAAAVFSSVIPTKVSLSDDRAVQYAVLALNCSTGASGTVSFSTQGSVEYVSDGSTV
jgi:hypothetical protein